MPLLCNWHVQCLKMLSSIVGTGSFVTCLCAVVPLPNKRQECEWSTYHQFWPIICVSLKNIGHFILEKIWAIYCTLKRCLLKKYISGKNIFCTFEEHERYTIGNKYAYMKTVTATLIGSSCRETVRRRTKDSGLVQFWWFLAYKLWLLILHFHAINLTF